MTEASSNSPGTNDASLTFQLEPMLSVDEFIDVLVRSTLGERRPLDDHPTMAGMLQHADLIFTARTSDGVLVGVARALTDYSFCTYLADLAVDVAYQGRGIGRRLLQETHRAAGLNTTLILLAAPKAQTYYPHIGLKRHESCWIVERRSG